MTDASDGKRDFFVSYTSSDEPWAEWLAWTVEEAGWSVWVQKWDFRGNFVQQMDRSVDLSDRTIGILSAKALGSKHVQAEWDARRAVDPRNEQDSLILIKVDLCEVPGILKPFIWLDLTQADQATIKAEIIAWLKRKRRKPGVAPLFPPASSREKPVRQPRVPGPIHNLPPRNPDFVGREEELGNLLSLLVANKPVVLTQAITGLGGVGKTQTALAYAHRHLADCRLAWWVRAEQPATLAADYAALALPLGQPEATEQPKQVEAVRRALEDMEGWLLVFDNVEDPTAVRDYFPRRGDGRVLLTSRRIDWQNIAKPLLLEVMNENEALQLLASHVDPKILSSAELVAAKALAQELGCLPLALAQAHAYMCETGRDFASYRKLLQDVRPKVLARGRASPDYPASVAKTWQISIEAAARTCAAAQPLLELLAFFAPDALPMAVLAADPEALPSELREELERDEAIAALNRLSLLRAKSGNITIHRLVQAVTRDGLKRATAKTRAEAAVRLLEKMINFDVEHPSKWSKIQPLLPHVLTASEPAEQLKVGLQATAKIMNHAGLYYAARAAWAEAEPLYRRALSIFEKELGPEHPTTATVTNNLADLYRATGRYEQAEPLFRRALTITEKNFGFEHFNVIITCSNNLAALYLATGRYEQAEPLLQRVIKIIGQDGGLEHPNYAGAYNNLAKLYEAAGRHAEAEPIYKHLLSTFEKELGPEHPTILIIMGNLAGIYYNPGNYAEAEPYLMHTLTIYEKTYGPEHPNVARTLGNLAQLQRATGRYAEAELLLLRELAITEKNFGPEHQNFVQSLEKLALFYRGIGRYEQVESLYRRALAINEKALRPEHFGVAISLNNLAKLYWTIGRDAEAEPLFRRALAILDKSLPADHPYRALVRENYAPVLDRLGRGEEAAKLRVQAEAIRQRRERSQSPPSP